MNILLCKYSLLSRSLHLVHDGLTSFKNRWIPCIWSCTTDHSRNKLSDQDYEVISASWMSAVSEEWSTPASGRKTLHMPPTCVRCSPTLWRRTTHTPTNYISCSNASITWFYVSYLVLVQECRLNEACTIGFKNGQHRLQRQGRRASGCRNIQLRYLFGSPTS